jgi:hypothetical protein
MSSTHSELSPSVEKKEAYLPQADGEGEGETGISPQTLEEGDAPLGKVTGASMRVDAPSVSSRLDTADDNPQPRRPTTSRSWRPASPSSLMATRTTCQPCLMLSS